LFFLVLCGVVNQLDPITVKLQPAIASLKVTTAVQSGHAMPHRTTPSAFAGCRSDIFRGLLITALVFPFTGCAKTPPPTTPQTTSSPAPSPAADQQPQAPSEEVDCLSISTLPEKRACLAKQDAVFIDDCERMRPMACKPYRELYVAEQTLQRTEANLLQSAQQAYAGYTENDPAYLDDLAASARESNAAWRAYREAQCALEPFAQGMSRSESENLAEACRLAKTQARIAELDALKAATGR
jgi:Lysozyme inhibitor LprI